MANQYLDQVIEEQREVEAVLNRAPMRKKAAGPTTPPPGAARGSGGPNGAGPHGSERQVSPVDVRVTGWWRYKTVIVPPNAYVVQTRRGHDKPIKLGLGLSLGFDPYTDSYLVVPATMQTIMVSANCICAERQGIVVQGYVQWIIEDFATAYRKLDFSDPDDPMRVVNVQLREQAEATIKDTVATMSINDVLADKQPIIKELTRRLREVAEGQGQGEGGGLGLRIVTVQIKEAVVASQQVWESLQRPYRAERQRIARLAELEEQGKVAVRESEAEKQRAATEIATQAEVANLRDVAEATAFDRAQREGARRARVEAETIAAKMEHEREHIAKDLELERLRLEAEQALAALRRDAQRQQREQEIALEAKQRAVSNDVSEARLREQLVEQLPQVMRALPQPRELRTVQVGPHDTLTGTLATIHALLDALRASPNGQAATTGNDAAGDPTV